MSTAIIKRIRRNLQGELADIYARFTGEHNLTDIVNAVEMLLRGTPDVMPAIKDIAYMVTQAEDHRRTSISMPKSMDMFTREWAQEAEIRLGEGQRVSYANATNRQLRKKQSEQIKSIKRDTEAAEFVANLIDIMDDHASAHNLTEAMEQAGLWPHSSSSDRDPPSLYPV